MASLVPYPILSSQQGVAYVKAKDAVVNSHEDVIICLSVTKTNTNKKACLIKDHLDMCNYVYQY